MTENNGRVQRKKKESGVTPHWRKEVEVGLLLLDNDNNNVTVN